MSVTELRMEHLERALVGFTGTEHWYRHMIGPIQTGLLYTDGVAHLAGVAGAYWLIDIVGTVFHKFLGDDTFQLWRIEVNEDATATVTMRRDTGLEPLYTKNLGYTDFPVGTFEWYVCDNVMLLKSEY